MPLLVVLFSAILAAAPASAQVRGRVVDASDRPVAGAIVEVWVDSRQAAAAETDACGGYLAEWRMMPQGCRCENG